MGERGQYPLVFLSAVAKLLRDEGGYVAIAGDPGGETKFGISRRSYPDLDIKGLTKEDAIAIYFRDWWDRYGYGRLPDPIAAKVFDLAVDIGPDEAILCLQRALRACGSPVAEDGKLGPQTCLAVAQASVARASPPGWGLPAIQAALRSEFAGWYRVRAAREARDDAFLKGWLNRAYE